ncbi:uncharacterized protein LOC135395153 [Ornithodoros turicata]|uniref:uncharacterized protein LOC135395153 n=1 Tax=Ornithodoros turicata TaxID=34597 RepID=UPI00313A470C
MTNEWSSDLSTLPGLSAEYIDGYYALKTGSDRHRRRSYKFSTESYVSLPTLKTKRVASAFGPVVAVRCACFRSRKKTADPYIVNLTLTIDSRLSQASCTCTAGASGHCNHLMAVLRQILLLQSLGYKEPPEELAPTELPQQWRRPRKAMAPENIMDVNWRRVGEGRPLTPRQCTIRQFVHNHIAHEKQVEASVSMAKALEQTHGCWSAILAEAPSCHVIETQSGPSFVGSAKAVQMPSLPSGFECLVPWKATRPVEVSSCAPPYKFFPDESSWCPVQELDHNEILEGLKVSTEDASMLELNTRQQARSQTWRSARTSRLTASRFGAVLARKQQWTERGILNIMRPKSFSNAIVRHGTVNEPRAVQRYVQVMEHLGHNVIVHTCGLMVRPGCPWLGATPDRVVYDAQEDPPFGLVEVKCPWNKKSCSMDEALASPDFYIELLDDVPQLKASSGYYCQVMGQMYCSGLQWTHFVVYTDNWIIVCKVQYVESVWMTMKARLDDFYFSNALPVLSQLVQE